ncbi:MAG: hypothetical protein ACRDD2_10865, partial [Sarcina sp.]
KEITSLKNQLAKSGSTNKQLQSQLAYEEGQVAEANTVAAQAVTSINQSLSTGQTNLNSFNNFLNSQSTNN